MKMKKIRVADYIASRCANFGAREVFLVTGGGAMHLNDAFNRHPDLKTTCFHHEQAASMAAEGYYKINNQPAIVNVTTGPGGINALNGVFGAYVDSCAMIIVSGQVKRDTYSGNFSSALRQLGDQEVRIVDMAKSIVKYATVLQDPNQVKAVMDKALFLSTHGRPGPVWIDVPVDIQGIQINEENLIGWDKSDKGSLISDPSINKNTVLELKKLENNKTETNVTKLLTRLKRSKRPAILVGTGVRASGMLPTFRKIADKLGIPVVTGWNAHDSLPDTNELHCGRPGTVGDRAGNFCVQNSDFLLILGARLNIRQISYNWKQFAPRAWKAMIDVDLSELQKKTLNINFPVHADLKQFLPKMEEKLAGYERSKAHLEYLRWCRERVKKYQVVLPEYSEKSIPINPYFFIENLFQQFSEDEIIVTANGAACVIGFQAAKLKNKQRLFTNSGNASMGYDLPAAVGACIASGGKRVICIAGDGSIMMNLQELQTIAGNRYPIKIIIINNGGYQSIIQTQKTYFPDNQFGTNKYNGLTLPNFIKIEGKECLFTENFIEKDGKEYEIVMVAEGFSWEDILIYDEDEEDDE